MFGDDESNKWLVENADGELDEDNDLVFFDDDGLGCTTAKASDAGDPMYSFRPQSKSASKFVRSQNHRMLQVHVRDIDV